MAFQVANNLRFRRSFGRIRKIIDLPYLIEIQKNSYDLFLQRDIPPTQRQNLGLQEVFKSVFPIKDFNETASLEFVSYALGEPKYDVEECHQRGMTYAAPLKVTVQLVLWDVDNQTGSRSIKNVKEQEVYFGEIPLMTTNGTFMVNGTERVIVSQLHRSPGVFFEHDKGKTHASGKLLYSARVIPYRGSWVDLEFDPRDILYVRIDRRRKFHATVLLRALGMTTEDLLNYYYKSDAVVFDGRKPALVFNANHLLGGKVSADVRDPKSNELIVKEGKKFTRPVLRQMEAARVKQIPIGWEDILGRIASHDIVEPQTKEVLVECNHEITQEKLDLIREKGIPQIDVLFIDESSVGPYLRNTLLQDRIRSPQDAVLEIYRRLRPGDPPTVESATNFFNNLFFNPDRYDLSKVGRLKLNHRLKLNVPLEQGTLRKEDILEVVRYLMELKNGNGSVDDIDHLGNRRDARERLFRERAEGVRHGTCQPAVDVHRASAHAGNNAGLGQRSAFEPGQNQIAPRSNHVPEHAENVNLELFDLAALPNGEPGGFHAGLDLIDGEVGAGRRQRHRQQRHAREERRPQRRRDRRQRIAPGRRLFHR